MAALGRLTIPRRVFLGFAIVLTAFGAVAFVSLVQHQRSASTLRLLHRGYLPLALELGEARATQTVFGTLLDRVLEESDSTASRSWLQAARRVRPATIGRALEGIDAAEALDPPEEVRGTLRGLRNELESVRRAYATGDRDFDELFAALLAKESDKAAAVLARVRRRERAVERALRGVWSTLQEQIAESSARAERDERRAVVSLALLAAVALVVGIGITWWSQRVLSPLPRLQARVEAVARGDLETRIAPEGDDEIGRLASEFERMVDALALRDAKLIQSERLAAVGRMAAHVTHEVRNPLSSIGLNLELLEEELGGANPEVRSLLVAIQREVDRLTGITEEYLRLARLPRPKLEPTDLTELVREVADFVRPEMAKGHVAIEIAVESRPSAAPTLVMIDESQVRQALLNLLRNAREAMPEGGRIEVRLHEEAGGVSVSVSDEGPGIPAEARARIFDPFYTTKERGTGLGLSLTQQIVAAHGGRIRADERSPRGAALTLWFPLRDTEAGPTLGAPHPTSAPTESNT